MEHRPQTFAVQSALPEDGGSTARARDITRDTLRERGYAGRHDDVVLVVSELVSNALRHGSGGPVLRLTGGADHVRIEVSDDSPAAPAPRESGPDGGWGLRVVERLAVRWGTDNRAVGKTVWCELVARAGAGVTPAPEPAQLRASAVGGEDGQDDGRLAVRLDPAV